MNQLTFQPIEGHPTALELQDVDALPDVPVTMTTYVNKQGEPVWLMERFRDPETGEPRVVWSRITNSLAYVRG